MTESPAIWQATLRREEARQAQQRADSANRRAAALADGVQALGSQAAVADTLGTSAAAVSKALHAANQRPQHEAVPGYLEIDLPRTGAGTPTTADWQTASNGSQQQAAARAATRWQAVATTTAHLAAHCDHAAETLAELLLVEEGSGDEQLRQATRAALPQWGDQIPVTEVEAGAMASVLRDMADSFHQRHRTAQSEADRWVHRAGKGMPGMHHAD